METKTRFSGHDKRVSLHLGLLSTVARQKPGLVEALQAAKDADFDLAKLTQEQIEIIYAAYDDEFEKAVLSEFEADPSFLIDLGHTMGKCPLCGHAPIRWLFRVLNTKGGQSVECGSECIITYGVCVKGAETAEHARKLLEQQIRKAIRKLLIEAWHTEYGFTPDLFTVALEGLQALFHAAGGLSYYQRRQKYREVSYRQQTLTKIKRWYDTTGWLNTSLRWGAWVELVKYIRLHNADAKLKLPEPKPYKPKQKKAAAAAVSEAPAIIEAPKTIDPPKQSEFEFSGVVQSLVFGNK